MDHGFLSVGSILRRRMIVTSLVVDFQLKLINNPFGNAEDIGFSAEVIDPDYIVVE